MLEFTLKFLSGESRKYIVDDSVRYNDEDGCFHEQILSMKNILTLGNCTAIQRAIES